MPPIETDPLVLALGPWLATESPRPLGNPGLQLAMSAAALIGEVATLLSFSPSRLFSPPDQERIVKEMPALALAVQRRIHEVCVELGPVRPPHANGRRRTGASARHAVLRGSLRRVLDTLPDQMDACLTGLRHAVTLGPQEQRLLQSLLNGLSEVFLLGASPPPISRGNPLPATLLVRWMPDLDSQTRTQIVTGLMARSTPIDVLALTTLVAQVNPDTLTQAGLWPLSPERVRPWLLHPSREIREAGMRMLDCLRPRELPTSELPVPEGNVPPRTSPPRRRSA